MSVIAFEGEIQMRRYSDTSTQGQQVVFALADRDALNAFIGKEGKRFAAVLVEIGPDEEPVTQPTGSKGPSEPVLSAPKEKPGPLCVMACHFCADPVFWDWVTVTFNPVGYVCSSEYGAKAFVLEMCLIDSRKKLDQSKRAAQIFHESIRKPFMAWRDAR